MKSRCCAWLAGFAFCILLVPVAPAAAEPRPKKAFSTKASDAPSDARPMPGMESEQAGREAFDMGRELARQGKYDAACAKFEESLALNDGVGILYHLADCEEHRGRFARAQTLFTRVAEEARVLGQTEREKVARERAMLLNPRVSLLQIEFQGTPSTLTLDGETIRPDMIRALPIDPGTHQISASASGKRAWSKDLRVPRPGLLLLVSVPELADAASAQEPNSRPRPTPRQEKPATRRANRAEARRSVPRAKSAAAQGASVALLAVGTGGVVAGTVFGLRYLSKNSEAKDTCPTDSRCTREDVAKHDQLVKNAKTARTYAYLGFGGGAAALVGAAVLHFTIGPDQPVNASTGLNPDGSFGATLRGRF